MLGKSDIKGVDTASNPKPSSSLSVEGELPSIIVYSSEKHVPYITHQINYIRQTLTKKGFKVKLLSDETPDLLRYSDEFVKIAAECVYGVILLDGFRPNVLFEFGILFGLKKPISVLMADGAFIAVKTLYENDKEAGLDPDVFEKELKDPKLRLGTSNHFSDLSTHILRYNDTTSDKKEEHVSKILEKSIELKTSEINEELQKINSRPEKGIDPNCFQKYQTISSNIVNYYTNSEKYGADDIEQLCRAIRNLEEISGYKMPSESRRMIASLYNSLSEKSKRSDFEMKTYYLSSALTILNEALEFESDPIKKAEIRKKIGNTYSKLSQNRDRKEDSIKAISAYEESLKVRTLEKYPMEYAMTQNDLGNAYSALADMDMEDKAQNSRKAISAYEESLKVRTFEQFPMEYAMTQNDLGNAYSALADMEDKAQNSRKAISAYEESLKVRTFEKYPMEYAMTQNDLGAAYWDLADVEDKAQNCRKAISAYEESLKVRTFEEFPRDYAIVQINLGAAYWTLADVEGKAQNCRKAISAYEESLKVMTLKQFPRQYAMTQNNLGNAYSTLAEVEDKDQNCRKAISAYEESLKVNETE